MTEVKTPSEKVEQATPSAEHKRQPDCSLQETQDAQEYNKANSVMPKGILLGIIAILLTLTVTAGLYYQGQQQTKLQQTENQRLQDQLNALHQQRQQENHQIEASLKAQHQALNATKVLQESQANQLTALQQKMTAISGSDAKIWLLAQADFLVKLAGRKLWIDQDVTTATLLLKSTDTCIAEMHDPSLINIRRAITEDISTLSTLNQIDFDGIILTLNQLANQVDNLRLTDDSVESNSAEENNETPSSSLSEWRQNLVKSWHNFMSNFITIRHRDGNAAPLLAPNQDIYLRENIRARLLIAVQAVPRHQNEVYRQSLEAISTWVHAYFDQNDLFTKAFLTQLEALSQQSIDQALPTELKSQTLLDKQIQSRFGNLITMPMAQGE